MAKPLKGILRRMAGKFFRSPRVRHLELKSGPSKGRYNTPALRNERFSGTIPSKEDQKRIWQDFDKSGGARDQFLDHVRKNATITDLQAMGMTNKQAEDFLKNGIKPKGFQVHHIVPRKAGGGNEMSNLVLIRNNPDHKLLTAQQNSRASFLRGSSAAHGGASRRGSPAPASMPSTVVIVDDRMAI